MVMCLGMVGPGAVEMAQCLAKLLIGNGCELERRKSAGDMVGVAVHQQDQTIKKR